MQVTVEVEFVRNIESGEVHRVLRLEGKRFAAEQCNTDQIAHKAYLTEETAAALHAEDYGCGHCWPLGDSR